MRRCVGLAFVVVLLSLKSDAGPQPNPGQVPCDKSRKVYTEPWGIITDGPQGSNYTQDSHCEWLIKANSSEQFITLKFQSMGTECSYDYVFVYDGDSFNSTVLGSFSGKTEPQQVTATSGFMLILLYSDTNYVLDGFRAEYSISNCPGNCSGHGECVAHMCICESDWGGRDCGRELCPERCGGSMGRGRCVLGQCQCNPGFSGQACSLYRGDPTGNRWHWLYEGGITPRAAHTAIYLNETDALYVFGGYDLNTVLGDLLIFRFNLSQWEDEEGNLINGISSSSEPFDSKALAAVLAKVGTGDEEQWGLRSRTFFQHYLFSIADNNTLSIRYQGDPHRHTARVHREIGEIYEDGEAEIIEDSFPRRPMARYAHAACNYPGGFVIYGGKLKDGSLSSELWLYEVVGGRWTLRATESVMHPPALARHTITLANDGWMYLVGGATEQGQFSSKVFKIKLNTVGGTEEWSEVIPRGGKELDVRIVAHTTVYNAQAGSLLVYGGIVASVARFSKLSDRMFSFHLESRHWTEIHYPRAELRDTYVPRERAFHTTTVVGNYLVVFGGYTHRHNKEEICYDKQLYLYHLGCHTWVSHDILGPPVKASRYPKQQGVFAHAAALRNGNTLLLVGGYHGNINADLLAYTLPPTIASRDGEPYEPEQVCSRHHSLSECTGNPECGWCSADEICYGRTLGINCTTNLQTTRCPGICPALGDCHSCLLHGDAPAHLPASASHSVAHKLHLGQCTWCVQNARCHHKDDNFGVCGLREDTPSQVAGWWGDKGSEVVNADTCREVDRRPGLTFLKYKHPANWTQPDSVSIINATTADFNAVGGPPTRIEQSLGGEVTARLLGFLRPPHTWENIKEQLRICVSYSTASLRLASADNHLEIVANLSAEHSQCLPALWPSGGPVVLLPGRYLVDFEARKALAAGPYAVHHSKMELQHNKTHENPKVFTFEYLEPYEGNGSCTQYTNCLHCLSDSLCGWCDANSLCLPRQDNEKDLCRFPNQPDDWHYLTLVPSQCINCSNYVDCEACVDSGICEWWTEDARCARKGRSPSAVTEVGKCPPPCFSRENCTQCLDGNGRCVWCQATQECFSFAVYTSQYQFGLCREWLDQAYHSPHSMPPRGEASAVCDVCGRHSNCSTCLRTLGCGWCYDLDNPIKGVCVPGDFSQPYVESCNIVVNGKHNTSLYPDEVSWSYAQCPDVDECGLGLHDCHPEAKCTNTHGSYSCQCRRGFIGDGKHSCTKTCYNKCINGYCVGAPAYACKCDLGWTGPDCATNCGCNNHSNCSKGVGICDDCHDWTTGEFCQYCRAGSYGNATSSEGCRGCNCNEHGNAALGVCDSVTGVCFCQDNTEGPTCNKCKKGYYGDPRRGGTCYFQCMARGMLTSSEPQGLGSRLAEMSVWESRQGPPSRECLWIVSPHDLHNKTDTASVIQLTIDSDIAVTCTENSVYVYDGLPDFVSTTGNHQSHVVLGVFCTQDTQYPVTVEAKTGVLTVHYKQGEPVEGFNATVTVLSCPDKCPRNRVCRQGQCLCPEGSVGPDCSDVLCPNNCSADLKQGFCDKGYGRCLCSEGWGGPQCSVKLNPSQLVFTELFNSAHLADNLDHLRKMLPRFGHSLLTDRRGSLWLFGGYSLSHGPLNDIRLFDTKNNTWMQVTVDSTNDANMPQGRYFHAAEIVQSKREIFVYGGLTQRENNMAVPHMSPNNTLNDFWKFSLKNTRWIDIQTPTGPPPLAGHTLTLRRGTESESLMLIGGFSPRFGFLHNVWEFDLEKETWAELETSGNGPLGVYGHSTVYHVPTQSFYVFGGYMYGVNRTFISNKLYAFHYPTHTWSVLPIFEEYNPPRMNLPHARFLHTAVTTDEFLLVFGGRTDTPYASDSLIAYSYACNQWIRLLSKDVKTVGNPPPATYAHAMTLDPETSSAPQTVVYVMGGFAGGIQSHVTRISLPSDLCRLWAGKDKCRSFLGCSYCAVVSPNGVATSYCYSNSRTDHSDPCQDLEGTHKTNNGVVCNAEWLSQRVCEQYTTCTDCLARWPTHWDEPPVCKWCGKCARSRCVPATSEECDRDNKCRVVSNVSQCAETQCAASDCEKCQALGNCLWTRQVLLTSEQGVKVTGEPVYDWNCVAQNYIERISIMKNSGSLCLPRCSQHKDCDSCLSSQGAEGGWHECHWSTKLNECVSPGYQPLYCAGGVCGLVLSGGSNEHCPQACSSYKQCSTCLRHAHCGWCSLDGTNSTGQGVCSEGSLDRFTRSGPARSTCDVLYIQETEGNQELPETALFSWHYVKCPPENECLNGHHSCDERSEECVDLPVGYQCICGKGYRSEKSECIPVCKQGCVRGKCIAPDNCRCDFGYVGANCSIQCQCNGHSECEGPDKLDKCLNCHNNTQGPQCQRCKPLFVGDPTDNGECVPCIEYCNGHTHVCINDSITDFPFTPASPLSEIILHLGEGPTARARCVWCGNKTTGDKCDECVEGNFRGTEDHRAACRPCECHGHGDTCDPVTGEKCNCANNTESDATCQSTSGNKNNHQCWTLQCSKCRDSYSGTPIEGHQCYKQMSVDYKFCLDAKLIEECKMKPKPLNVAQTVFFMVQPRFMNVDIRLTVDVTQGGLDLYLSPRDDTFVVDVNATTGAHTIDMDPRYIRHANEDSFQFVAENSSTSSLWVSGGQTFNVVERSAKGLTTFITLNHRNTLLFVKNLTDRLVLTLPEDKHELGSTRFYIALTAVGRPAYGVVFFRQDQLHIDLFVFFSVFFSCFFLFLAACVVAWKAKQAADVRRARRRHVVEMLHMAKRPFASVTLLLDNSRYSPHRGGRRGRTRPPGEVRPLAVEPTDDGIAAVGTVFVKLPGSNNVPVKLALASTLILLARVYPTNNRAFLRRRSSHS